MQALIKGLIAHRFRFIKYHSNQSNCYNISIKALQPQHVYNLIPRITKIIYVRVLWFVVASGKLSQLQRNSGASISMNSQIAGIWFTLQFV